MRFVPGAVLNYAIYAFIPGGTYLNLGVAVLLTVVAGCLYVRQRST